MSSTAPSSSHHPMTRITQSDSSLLGDASGMSSTAPSSRHPMTRITQSDIAPSIRMELLVYHIHGVCVYLHYP